MDEPFSSDLSIALAMEVPRKVDEDEDEELPSSKFSVKCVLSEAERFSEGTK